MASVLEFSDDRAIKIFIHQIICVYAPVYFWTNHDLEAKMT